MPLTGKSTVLNAIDFIFTQRNISFENLVFLNMNKRITVLDISETYANKGTRKYFRVYAEVEKNGQ